MMKLGKKLKVLRKCLPPYTLVEVSEATSISVSFLSDIERCKTNPSLKTLYKLAAFYNVSMADLFMYVEEG